MKWWADDAVMCPQYHRVMLHTSFARILRPPLLPTAKVSKRLSSHKLPSLCVLLSRIVLLVERHSEGWLCPVDRLAVRVLPPCHDYWISSPRAC